MSDLSTRNDGVFLALMTYLLINCKASVLPIEPIASTMCFWSAVAVANLDLASDPKYSFARDAKSASDNFDMDSSSWRKQLIFSLDSKCTCKRKEDRCEKGYRYNQCVPHNQHISTISLNTPQNGKHAAIR